ncbi:MAG: SH3 domain-containing protein [Nitrospinales bacterium]
MKKILLPGILLFFVYLLWNPVPCKAQADDITSIILKANDFYKEKNYAKAEELYQSALDRGLQNGFLYYNLGNTHIRLGNTGKAILNYLHAKKFLPRDQDLQANLKYSVQHTVDLISWEEKSLLKSLFFWVDNFNLKEHLLILISINICFWISLSVWLYKKNEGINLFRKIVFAVLILSLASTAIKWSSVSDTNFGVILHKTIDVKSGMDKNNTTLFQLHEGAIVSIEKEEAGWFKIKLKDGKSGWAKKDAIGI